MDRDNNKFKQTKYEEKEQEHKKHDQECDSKGVKTKDRGGKECKDKDNEECETKPGNKGNCSQ